MSEKPKPCPFCGSEPLMVHSALNEYHSVAPKIGCSHCRYIIQAPDLAIDMNKSVKENCDFEDWQTISYWNTRPAEEDLKAEITRYRRALHNLKEDCTRRKHFAVSDEEKLFLYETISHIEAELDFNPDTEKGGEDE